MHGSDKQDIPGGCFAMRPLSSQFPPGALTTLDDFMKQAKKTVSFVAPKPSGRSWPVIPSKRLRKPSISPILPSENGSSALLEKALKDLSIDLGQDDLAPSPMKSKPVSIVFSNKTPCLTGLARHSGTAENSAMPD
jgi:hypothetical protein